MNDLREPSDPKEGRVSADPSGHAMSLSISGRDLVLLLLDARSFPAATLEGKITLALELRKHALAVGLTDEQLI